MGKTTYNNQHAVVLKGIGRKLGEGLNRRRSLMPTMTFTPS